MTKIGVRAFQNGCKEICFESVDWIHLAQDR